MLFFIINEFAVFVFPLPVRLGLIELCTCCSNIFYFLNLFFVFLIFSTFWSSLQHTSALYLLRSPPLAFALIPFLWLVFFC